MEVIIVSRNFKYPLFYYKNKLCVPMFWGIMSSIFLFLKVKDMSEWLNQNFSSNTNLLQWVGIRRHPGKFASFASLKFLLTCYRREINKRTEWKLSNQGLEISESPKCLEEFHSFLFLMHSSLSLCLIQIYRCKLKRC